MRQQKLPQKIEKLNLWKRFTVSSNLLLKSYNPIVIVKPWFQGNVLEMISQLNLGFRFFFDFLDGAYAQSAAHMCNPLRICAIDQTA